MIDKNEYEGLSVSQLNDKFIAACENGRLDVVKYLLVSQDLKEHANIHIDDDLGLACQRGHLEVVKWLLFDMRIEKTTEIEAFLSSNDEYDEISSWFKIRELNDRLDKSLSSDKIISKKIKL